MNKVVVAKETIDFKSLRNFKDYISTVPRYVYPKEDEKIKDIRFDNGIVYFSNILKRFNAGHKLNRMDRPMSLLIGYYDSTKKEWLSIRINKINKFRETLLVNQTQLFLELLSSATSFYTEMPTVETESE